ncbi:MAG: hypothetical protein V3S89_03765 [Desulfobacterales bacterium]
MSQSDIQQSDEKAVAPSAVDGQILYARVDQTIRPDANPQHRSIHIEADREMVRIQAARELNRPVSEIESIAPSEIYAVNRFRIDNGREAVVYTRLPITLASYRESY